MTENATAHDNLIGDRPVQDAGPSQDAGLNHNAGSIQDAGYDHDALHDQYAVPVQDVGQPTEAPRSTPRLFRRSRTDRMLGGVCGGLAETLGVDASLLRVGLVAATLLDRQ